MGPPPNFDATRQRGAKGFGGVLGQGSPLSIVQPGHVSGLQGNTLNNGNSNANQCTSWVPSVLPLGGARPLLVLIFNHERSTHGCARLAGGWALSCP